MVDSTTGITHDAGQTCTVCIVASVLKVDGCFIGVFVAYTPKAARPETERAAFWNE